MSIGGKFILLGAAFVVVLLVVVYGGGSAQTVPTPLTVAVNPPVTAPKPPAAVTTRVIQTRLSPAKTAQATAPSASPSQSMPAITMGKPLSDEIALFFELDPPPAAAVAARPGSSAAKAEVTVQAGDTLTAIAARTLGDGMEWRQFVTANPGLNPKRLRIGQTLKIPQATASRSSSATKPVAGKPAEKTYRTGKGDTLTSIASTYYGDSTRWTDIFVANKKALGGNPDQLRVDLVLVIP
jgi:nucleoid-associated protein YgaU